MKTLTEVAAEWRLTEQMSNPVLWLTRRIRSGQFRARRVGRRWMMTDADMAHNLDALTNVSAPAPSVPDLVGVPSLASRRRRSA